MPLPAVGYVASPAVGPVPSPAVGPVPSADVGPVKSRYEDNIPIIAVMHYVHHLLA